MPFRREGMARALKDLENSTEDLFVAFDRGAPHAGLSQAPASARPASEHQRIFIPLPHAESPGQGIRKAGMEKHDFRRRRRGAAEKRYHCLPSVGGL